MSSQQGHELRVNRGFLPLLNKSAGRPRPAALALGLGLLAVGLAGVATGCRDDAPGKPGAAGTGTGAGAVSADGTTLNGAKIVGSKKPTDPVRVAFVSNNQHEFWNIARAGTEKAKSELTGVDVEFVMPLGGELAKQRGELERLGTSGIDGVAVSPIDAAAMQDVLDALAAKVPLVCQDNDAPKSRRLVYIGTNNTEAGKLLGEAFLKLRPEGGNVVLFCGSKTAPNAVERAEGFKQATAGKVNVLEFMIDDTDHGKAKSNVETALKVHGDKLAGLVGLWAYNGTAINNVLKDAGDAGKRVTAVCFDEDDGTLDGIKEGRIGATVVQNPFEFGRQSVHLLAALARGDKSKLPAGFPEKRNLDIPARVITKDNVDEFRADLIKKKKGQG
jgi:ribose transport system substrate-binding protein